MLIRHLPSFFIKSRKKREVHFLYTSPIHYSVASAVALAAAGVVSVLSVASETLLLPSLEALVSDFVFALLLLFDVLLLEVLLLEDALLVFFFGVVVVVFFVDDEDVDVFDLCDAVEELLVVCFFGVVCVVFLLVVVEDEVDDDDVLGRRRYVDEVEDEVDVLEDVPDDDVDVEDVAGVETLVSVSSWVVSGVSFTTLAATILNVYSNSPVYFLIPFAMALALPTFLLA